MRLTAIGFACLFALTGAACAPTADLDGTSGRLVRTSNITLVQIAEDHVGGITGETQYGQKAIEAALPGFTTEGIQNRQRKLHRVGTCSFQQ